MKTFSLLIIIVVVEAHSAQRQVFKSQKMHYGEGGFNSIFLEILYILFTGKLEIFSTCKYKGSEKVCRKAISAAQHPE